MIRRRAEGIELAEGGTVSPGFLKLTPSDLAVLAEMPPGFDPYAPIETNMTGMYEIAHALRVPVP